VGRWLDFASRERLSATPAADVQANTTSAIAAKKTSVHLKLSHPYDALISMTGQARLSLKKATVEPCAVTLRRRSRDALSPRRMGSPNPACARIRVPRGIRSVELAAFAFDLNFFEQECGELFV